MTIHAMHRATAAIALTGGLMVVGLYAAPASASGTTSSAEGFVFTIGSLPTFGPGVRVSGDCPLYMFADLATFTFLSGRKVVYGPATGTSGGFNAEGVSSLSFSGPGGTDGTFEGHTHLWANLNLNPTGNPQLYSGVTGSVNATGVDGTVGSLSITASGGETVSATGHVSGWGHFNITCSGIAP
jgi:hypothetical protein